MKSRKLDRRAILATAVGTLVQPRIVWSQASNLRRPSLGFSLYGMKNLSLNAALRACAQIGYQHVEFALNPGYATEPTAFSPASRQATKVTLKELNLDLPCLMLLMSLTADSQAHATALELIAVAGQMAHELVPDRPPNIETVLGGSPAKWDEQKSAMVDRLQDWASTAERAKVVIAIKAHVNSAVNSPERLLWLKDEVKSPAIALAYDYSHFEVQGIDMEESMRLLLPLTQFVHVKDSQGDLAKFQFLLPGEGRTDYVKYFSLLHKYDYAGPVCVEVSGQVFNKPNYDPIAAATQCYSTLSAALAKSLLD